MTRTGGLAVVLVSAMALTVGSAAAGVRCKPGEEEDPATGQCRAREAPHKASKAPAPAPAPAWGDSPEEKERKAELHREICQKQCERDRTRCRDTNCDDQNRLCLELCFKNYLLELPAERAAAVQAQETLRGAADEKLSAVQKAAEAMARMRDRCRSAVQGAAHDLGSASERTCDALSEAVDGEAARRVELAQKARLQFDAARKELEVKEAMEQLDRAKTELERKAQANDKQLEPVEALAARWAALVERAAKARAAAELSAAGASSDEGELSGLVRRRATAEGAEAEKAATAAAREAKEASDGAAQSAAAVKTASGEAEGARLADKAEKLAQDASAARARTQGALDAEKQRQGAWSERERLRAQQEQDRRAREAAAQRRLEEQREAAFQTAFAQREAERDHAHSYRQAGYGFAIGTALVAAGTVTLLYLGSQQNDAIKKGGFNTSQDIVSAANTGQTFNLVATGLGIATGVGAAIATPLILFNPDPGPLQRTASGGAPQFGLALSGSFQ
jgi:hypothetical protein